MIITISVFHEVRGKKKPPQIKQTKKKKPSQNNNNNKRKQKYIFFSSILSNQNIVHVKWRVNHSKTLASGYFFGMFPKMVWIMYRPKETQYTELT